MRGVEAEGVADVLERAWPVTIGRRHPLPRIRGEARLPAPPAEAGEGVREDGAHERALAGGIRHARRHAALDRLEVGVTLH